MAKKPKSDNFDALGSVFDFLFTEAKKKPEKRRPIKPTEVSGTSAMTQAIFAALEKPGAFISDTVVGEFNSALDYELSVLQLDEFGKLKVTTNSLIDFLKDPQKAIEKSVAKSQAIRKSQRAMFMGAAVTDFVTAGWARKYADLESQKAIYGTTVARKIKNEQEKQRQLISKAVGQAATTHGERGGIFGTQPVQGIFHPNDLDFMANRSAELLGKHIFKENVWNSMSPDEKKEFLIVASSITSEDFSLKEGYKQNLSRMEKYLSSKYPGSSYIQNFRDILGKDFDPKKTSLYDVNFYKRLEKLNIEERIKALENLGVRTREQESQLAIYKKTKYLIDRDTSNLVAELRYLKERLRNTTDKDERKRIKKEISDTKGALNVISGNNFIGQIGRLEGYLGSINAVHGANMIPSILNGSFYDKNVNSFFNPAQETKINIAGNRGKELEYTFYTAARSGGDGRVNKLIDAYNEIGVNLYYFTPRSVFRTFFYNGEGFAYMMTKHLKRLESGDFAGIMKKLKGVNIDQVSVMKVLGEKVGDEFDKNLEDLMLKAGGILSKEELASFSSVLKSVERYKKLTEKFSAPFRVKSYINSYFGNRLKKVRVKVAKWLMSNPTIRDFFAKTGASRLLGTWIAKGGIKTFLQSIATAVAGALGIVGTPLASALISALTWVATDFAMKVLAQMLVVGKYMLLGILGLIVLIFFWASGSVKSFNKNNYSYYNETPGSIIQCSLYEERDLGTGDDAPWGEAIIPPPSGESCVLGAGSFWCSQGYKDTKGWSHQNIGHLMPVDLTSVGYIYAPQFCSTGNCSITRIAVINCRDGSNAGGIVELTASNGSTTYLFKLLHVKPLAGLGEKLSGGQPVAVVQDRPEVERGWCWTGKHLHLETRQNGAIVDPLKLLQSFSCNVPDESGCARP